MIKGLMAFGLGVTGGLVVGTIIIETKSSDNDAAPTAHGATKPEENQKSAEKAAPKSGLPNQGTVPGTIAGALP